MLERKVSGLPVVDAAGCVVGIVSEVPGAAAVGVGGQAVVARAQAVGVGRRPGDLAGPVAIARIGVGPAPIGPGRRAQAVQVVDRFRSSCVQAVGDAGQAAGGVVANLQVVRQAARKDAGAVYNL